VCPYRLSHFKGAVQYGHRIVRHDGKDRTFAIREPPRITQEYFGRQGLHWPHSGMCHEALRVGTLVSLLGNLLGQVLDFLLHLLVQGLQCAPSIRGMGQRQECDLGLPVNQQIKATDLKQRRWRLFLEVAK
jgi:hypothetical protein